MNRLSITIFATVLATAVTAFSPSVNQHNFNFALNAATLDGQEIRGEITPLGNFVLVRTKDTLAATGGGILLPDQVSISFILRRVRLSKKSFLWISD